MTAVAAAVAATVAMWDEGSDDEMSDGALYVWGADEHGSDLEDDPPEDDDAVPPPPPAAAGPGPKSVQERVRDMWDQYMLDHKIKNAATDPSSTHFAPWAPVGVVLGLRVREPFQGKAGMKQRIRPERLNTDSVTELECFEKMFTSEMQDRVIERTNAKVDLIKQGAYPRPARAKVWPPKWTEKWEPLTKQRLMLFIAVHVARAVTGVHETYVWESGKLTSTPGISRILPRDSYTMIKSALGFQADQEAGGFQQLPKIGELMDLFRSRCETRYQPGMWLSLDEMMVRFTGTTKYKFTREHKPISEGLKLFALCCPTTGYCYTFRLEKRDGTSIESTVLALAERVRGMRHVIVMDNLFTSVRTFKALLNFHTYAVGTARVGRGLPKAFEVAKSDKKKSALQAAGIPDKGDFVYAQTIDPDMPLTAILWHDSGPALFLSSFHDGETGAVLRREAGKSGRTQVQAPKAASDYNAYMCGCDTADQKRAQGSVMAKTYKWYIALFHWLLDQCVTNACVLWACENRGFQEDGSLDQPRTRRFRLALAEQLVVKAGLDLHMLVNDPQVSTYRVRASTGSDMVAYEQTLAKLKPERLLDNDHYVDCHNLWKEHCVLRAKDPTHKMPRKWNCVLCWALTGKQFTTEFCCTRCNVTLHPGGCFKQYHLPEPNVQLTYAAGMLMNANKARQNGAAAGQE